MKAISGNTRQEVWFEAISYLLADAPDHIENNLILEVKEPLKINDRSVLIEKGISNLLKESGLYPLHTVAETIFPAFEYKKHGAYGVFEVYPNKVYPHIQCLSANKIDTYAMRLVRGYNHKGEITNPLENILNRFKGELSRPNAKRSIYELSVDNVESLAINRNDTSYMGFPCLSHLSFKLSSDKKQVHLTAMYRSHYYVSKVLGNLLGLVRLQSFLARELGLKVGALVCHSTSAKLDRHPKLGKTQLQSFIKLINEN